MEETKAMVKLISSVIWSGVVTLPAEMFGGSACFTAGSVIVIAYIHLYLATRKINLKFENGKFGLWSLQKVQRISDLSFIVDKPFLLIKNST